MRILIAALALLPIAGCSIKQTVTPVPAQEIAEICVKRNNTVMMDGFLPAVQRQIEAHGIPTSVYELSPPARCQHTMDYTAQWRWDLAMFLWYAELRLYGGKDMIGRVEYDARSGGGRPDKFGTTEEKIGPLIKELLANVRYRPRPAAAAVTHHIDTTTADDPESKLRQLKWLRDEQLISDEEYEAKRREVLDRL